VGGVALGGADAAAQAAQELRAPGAVHARSVPHSRATRRSESLERTLAWDFDRIVVSHGDVLESGRHDILRWGVLVAAVMTSTDLERTRSDFAERLRQAVGLRSPALARAFGTVPREDFVRPGPWKILVPPNLWTYRDTPDGDPRHVCDNVLVALDASRRLNNGEPAALARWLDTLDLAPGDRVLHLGCGVGYYTAIVAQVVSRDGSVLGVEIDPRLAERARRNLAPYANVTVVVGNGRGLGGEAFDAIFVNAGATQVEPGWIDGLRSGGRLLVPLTVDVEAMEVGVGQMLLVRRCSVGHAARFVSPVGIFHCAVARSAEGEESLRQAYVRGGEDTVRSLRRDGDEEQAGTGARRGAASLRAGARARWRGRARWRRWSRWRRRSLWRWHG
jgi:protein-L-isoaspartate(D-aspartate) O-methyltransferase